MTVAEEVAAYLGEHCPHVFAIIGAGNMALLDAIARLGKTEVVYQHHEQACVMSAASYFRVSGIVSAAIVTTGAGSTNALTGVMSAYMDSIPVLVIAGNEASTRPDIGRARGVQGFDSVQVATPMTKAQREFHAGDAGQERLIMDWCFFSAKHHRPGPVWLTIPMDLQSAAA